MKALDEAGVKPPSSAATLRTVLESNASTSTTRTHQPNHQLAQGRVHDVLLPRRAPGNASVARTQEIVISPPRPPQASTREVIPGAATSVVFLQESTVRLNASDTRKRSFYGGEDP